MLFLFALKLMTLKSVEQFFEKRCYKLSFDIEKIKGELTGAVNELLSKKELKKGSIVVVGCSSSEIIGSTMGTNSVPELGEIVYKTISDVLSPKGIFIAAQCCEHLNRAIIIEREAAGNNEIVCAVPKPKAGGSFATAAWKNMKDPVTLEHIKADAGLDIGGVLIGMHLKDVAVPAKLSYKKIGEAVLLGAYTRPKYIGGERAEYK